MKPASSFLLSLLITLVGIPSVLWGQEIFLSEYKCKLTLPKGWNQREVSPEDRAASEDAFVVSAANTTGQTFSLFIMDVPKHLVIADTGLTNMVERGIEARGMTILERKHSTVAGVPAYTVRGQGMIDTVQVYVYALFLVANGHEHSLVFTSTTSEDPSASSDVQGIIRSFKFIGNPEPHVAPADMPPKKIALSQHKFSITLPGGWEQLPLNPNKDAQLVFKAADFPRLRLVTVELRPKLPISSVRDSALVRGFTAALEASKFSISDHGFMNVAGKEALWLRGTVAPDASVQSFVMFANDMTYFITIALSGGGDASDDAVLKKVVQSVGFGGK